MLAINLCALSFCFAVYGINNILFQRGIYPPEMFKQEKKYGITILVTTDDSLLKYLKENVLPQLTSIGCLCVFISKKLCHVS